MASGKDGHCPTHDLVSSSASHGGLEARIAEVAATSPSRRSRCAEWSAACAAGAVSGAPVHAGSAASTATTWPGRDSAHAVATAAPMETPPTAIASARAALSSASRYPSMSRSGSGGGVTTTAPTSCRAAENAR
jgi:hypothetical protein